MKISKVIKPPPLGLITLGFERDREVLKEIKIQDDQTLREGLIILGRLGVAIWKGGVEVLSSTPPRFLHS